MSFTGGNRCRGDSSKTADDHSEVAVVAKEAEVARTGRPPH